MEQMTKVGRKATLPTNDDFFPDLFGFFFAYKDLIEIK